MVIDPKSGPLLLLTLLMCAVSGVSAQTPGQVSQPFFDASSASAAPFSVAPAIDVALIDISKDVSVDWVYQPSQFFDTAGKIPSGGYSPINPRPAMFAEFGRAYWFHTTVINSGAEEKSLVLNIEHSRIRTATFFLYEEGELISRQEDGLYRGLSGKAIPVGNPVFELQLKPGARQDIYLHMSTLDSMRWNVDIWDQQHYAGHLANTNLILGLLVGVILVMMIYSYLVAGISGQRAYLYLANCLGALLVVQMSSLNLGPVYLWPEHTVIGRYILIPSLVLFLTTLLVFSHELLQVGETTRAEVWLSRMRRGMFWWVGIGVIPFGWLSSIQAGAIFTVTCVVPLVLTLLFAVIRSVKGHSHARIFLGACSPLVLLIIPVAASRVAGYDIALENVRTLVLAASALLSLALAAALALHIRKLEREYQASRQDALVAKLQAKEADLAMTSARQESEAKSAFLATMSHEIRTPMNGILGMAELLADTDLDGTQQTYVNTVRRSGDSLMAILNDILDYSKFESGNFELEERDVSSASLLDDITRLYRDPLKKKSLDLFIHIDQNVPDHFIVDDNRVKQILSNLLNNAIKFTDRGHIKIHLFLEGVAEQGQKHMINIKVQDQGVGIPADVLPNLFDRFKQADSSISRRFGGTGLGLAICKLLSERMGGWISAESREGEGSCFTIRLPVQVSDKRRERLDVPEICYLGENEALRRCLATFARWSGSRLIRQMNSAAFLILDEESSEEGSQENRLVLGRDVHMPFAYGELLNAIAGQVERQVASVSQDKPLEGCRILVAEDNATNRLVVGRLLANWGADVAFAENGEEAVSAFNCEGTLLDLILMDCEMPLKDGYTATIDIRESNNPSADIPIIALTAHALPEFRDRAHAVGMSDYVTKPLDKGVLLNAIQSCLA
ncbi:MAG: ATP-binding protein [Pseudomonadota bacterium]